LQAGFTNGQIAVLGNGKLTFGLRCKRKRRQFQKIYNRLDAIFTLPNDIKFNFTGQGLGDSEGK
jgi:hypothetical protein